MCVVGVIRKGRSQGLEEGEEEEGEWQVRDSSTRKGLCKTEMWHRLQQCISHQHRADILELKQITSVSGVGADGRVACKVWETSVLSGARSLTNRIDVDLMSWLIRMPSCEWSCMTLSF